MNSFVTFHILTRVIPKPTPKTVGVGSAVVAVSVELALGEVISVSFGNNLLVLLDTAQELILLIAISARVGASVALSVVPDCVIRVFSSWLEAHEGRASLAVGAEFEVFALEVARCCNSAKNRWLLVVHFLSFVARNALLALMVP